MRIPVWFLSIAVAAIFSLQGWTLYAIVDLKVDVAKLNEKVTFVEQIAKSNYEK